MCFQKGFPLWSHFERLLKGCYSEWRVVILHIVSNYKYVLLRKMVTKKPVLIPGTVPFT